jgi:peptidoglycan/xylan/chitin deacetylase (PgdA/CDA1 family)
MPPARAVFYALTAIALFVSARAVMGVPPSIPFIAAFGATYVAALLSGVLVLRLRVFVDAMTRGPRGAKGVVLTFDDGPDPDSTSRALAALDLAGAKATFFVIAKKAEAHPDLVRDIVARGHAIGLHSYAHDRLFALRGPSRWRKDLKRGARVLDELTGARVRLFRPPIGHTVPHTARIVRELGLRIIGWNVSARDGIAANAEAVARRVVDAADDGAIVLLHDAAERGTHEPAGVAALPAILEGLKKKGLAVVPLSDWT